MTPLMDGVIIKGVGGAYTVSTEEGPYVCNARGVFRNRQLTPLIGDRVEISVDRTASEPTGTLQTLLPRKNELRRPRAANIDLVIVTMAAVKPDFNPGLLDRYLLLVEHAGIPAVICINKADLTADETLRDIRQVYESAGYGLAVVSAEDASGLDPLRDWMRGKVSVFAGPSGVGKSSLINRLAPEARRETGEISEKIARGRHTTRHTEIIPVAPSGFCLDTPGFTSLDLSEIQPQQYAALFREFLPFLGRCRFTDCRHETEDDCAIKQQVGTAIHPLRYESYLNLYKGTEKGSER